MVRVEQELDFAVIFDLNVDAFPTTAEARLVDRLRSVASPYISLVAELDGLIVGHVMFSPVTLSGVSPAKIMGLAPVAVLRSYQHRGVGSELIRTGLSSCRSFGYGAVVVLGHASYYSRFGFRPASRYGISCTYEVEDQNFMAVELIEGHLKDKMGLLHYHSTFEEP